MDIARIIDVIQPDTKQSKWIVDNFRNGLLVVDNSFQRNYVWLRKHQVKLIETILLGYAIPEIYLWMIDTDPSSGDIKYSIVDGQQRIGAVFDFIDGKFALNEKYISEDTASYANKTFLELTDEMKKRIWSYPFTIRQIPQGVGRNEIVKMFLRLNSTDKSLNPQELRNAEFNGLFLENAKAIAELEFWTTFKVFNTDNVRRMKDIEFTSGLLIFLRKGIESELTQEAINQMYDLYNDEYNEKDEDYSMTVSILNEIQMLAEYAPEMANVVRRTTHLYTLFTLGYLLVSEEKHFTDEQKQKLVQFYTEYNSDENKDILVRDYKEYTKDATTSKQSRMARLKALRSYIRI